MDLLSVDIDSADLWVLRSILGGGGFRPRVVVVEMNPNYEFGAAAAQITFHDPATMPTLHERASWNGTCFFGASAMALAAVADEHHYVVVATEPLLDLVRNDLWGADKAAAAEAAPVPTPQRMGTGLLRSESLTKRLTAAPTHRPIGRMTKHAT